MDIYTLERKEQQK